MGQLYLDKIDINSKTITRDSCYIMIKESMHQESVTIIDIHAPNIRIP